jgi:ParB family chromosome partitioning protein
MPQETAVLAVPLDLIDPPEYELRMEYNVDKLHELAQDIAARGLLQPIGVRPLATSGRFVRVWGGRRLAAHKLLGLPTIPALLVANGSDDLGSAAAENLFRHDLTPVEEAYWIKAALLAGQTQDTIRLRLHRTDRWITERLDILEWPPDVQGALHVGSVTLGVAAALAQIDNDQYRAYLLESARTSGCSAIMARAWLADYIAERPRIITNQATVEELKAKMQNYVVLIECDGCGHPSDLTHTRTYRICRECQTQVDQGNLSSPPQNR